MLDERRTKENLRARFPADRKPYTTRYDYEDDSDLGEDDDGDDDILDDEHASPPRSRRRSRETAPILSFSKTRM